MSFFRMCLVIFGLNACASSTPSYADEANALLVVEWNQQVMSVAKREDRFLTLKGVRTVTMMHLAMHDTLNSIERRYRPYGYRKLTLIADPIAAITLAAYTVALDQYPDQSQHFNSIRDRWLAQVEPGNARELGVALGRSVALHILEQRAGDGWDNQASYSFHPMAPGVYAEFNEHSGTPEGFVFGAGWATASGFALPRSDTFRVPPPPAIDSTAYAKAFDEVKSVGRFQSMERSPDQTHLALWWKEFVESSHNRLARELAKRERLDLHDTTRLFALLNMNIFDAYISSFDNKFHYNHWRPYTAIRWADHDGNSTTKVERSWTNTHQHTYAFPSYPSAHGTACAAAMSAFTSTFGKKYDLTMRIAKTNLGGPFSPEINLLPATRSFKSFDAAARECSLSRVYLGIHFRYDSVQGTELGRQIGNYVSKHFLQPVAAQ